MVEVYVSGSTIDIGRQGENEARNIYFDLSELMTLYGEGTATLVHMRPSDQAPYICETETVGNYAVWTPSTTDTAYPGAGKCELRWVVGETLAKSIIYTTTIAPSITGAGEVPSPYKSWYDAIIAYIEANYAANGAPQEVREAIYTLLSKAAYTETGLTDELAIVQAWTAETISVTNNLTNCTNSNTATMAEQGSSYTGTLTADSGYILGTVTVTMGGSDITATVYSSGTITIPSVTGDIVITATAVPAVSSLSAVYTQSGTVYDTDALDTLKSGLVVTATYSDSSTATVPSADYTLSGTLTAGTSTVTVSYGGKTTTFNVTATHGFLYTPDKGLLSEQSYVSSSTISEYFTESVSGGYLNIYSAKSGVSSTQASLVYFDGLTYSTSAMLKIVFSVADMVYTSSSNTTTPGTFAMFVSNGQTGGSFGMASVGFARYSATGGAVRIRKNTAAASAWLTDEISLDTLHTLILEVENGAVSASLDGTDIYTDAALYTSTNYTSDTSIRIMRSNQNTVDINIASIEMRLE